MKDVKYYKTLVNNYKSKEYDYTEISRKIISKKVKKRAKKGLSSIRLDEYDFNKMYYNIREPLKILLAAIEDRDYYKSLGFEVKYDLEGYPVLYLNW